MLPRPFPAAWGPDGPHVPPPTPPPAPDGLAGFQPHPGFQLPQRKMAPASLRASIMPREPLVGFLTRYPDITAPGAANTSTSHVQAVANRANKAAGRQSLLRDYLATA